MGAFDGLVGSSDVKIDACVFHPCQHKTSQVIITNVLSLCRHLDFFCANEQGLCSRTGARHLSFRPKVDRGRATEFATGQEREYSVGMCEAYAAALRDECELRAAKNYVFVEIFSGPNAPLLRAGARQLGIPEPAPIDKVDVKGTC